MSKKQKTYYPNQLLAAAATTFFVGAGFLGYSITHFSGQGRNIASIPEAKNFEEELMRSIEVKKIGDNSKVVFPLKSAKGDSLCEKYEEVSIHFAAEGMSVSGKKPEIHLYLNCQEFVNKEFAEFEVPNQQVAKRKPSSQEVPVDKAGIKVEFKNVSWEWPDQWALEMVEYNSSSGDHAPIKPQYDSDIKRIHW